MDDSYFKAFPKFGDNNENDEICSPKLQKPKKVVMEPTISAATKAALLPKRKILAERNEAFTFINSLKPPFLNSTTSPARSVGSSCSSDHDDEDNSLTKPYDPVTNYLSPRPKFLRYNPNDKRKIFLHGHSEITEKIDGLQVVSTNCSIDSQDKTFEQGSVKEENVETETEGNLPSDHDDDDDDDDAEIEEDIEEFEEEEEEKCWSLLGLLNFLLVLGSLYLSTSYICSMNSSEAIPEVNAESEQWFLLQVEVAALVVLFTMVPALGLLYHSRRRNSKRASLPTQKNTDEEASLPTQKNSDSLPTKKNSGEEASLPIETHQPNAEPVHQIQIQNTNAIHSEEEEYVEKVASFTSPSTPLASMNVTSGELSRPQQAPIVELLGELVIGEETFVRSSKMTRMPDPEERNASNSLSTQMMKSRSKTSLVQNQTHLELSTADCTSHKKKRPVKEESNGGEVSMSTMTPVRRSNRIRNKAMSP